MSGWNVGAVLALAFALLGAPVGTVELAAFALLVLAVVVMVALRIDDVVARIGHTGPWNGERALHGAFRRQSAPDVAGRPRPRAPGAGPRPA